MYIYIYIYISTDSLNLKIDLEILLEICYELTVHSFLLSNDITI